MMKTSSQLVDALQSTSIGDSKIISSSSENNEKSTKSDFINAVYKVEESSFLTSNIRQVFTKLMQKFTKTPIFKYFHFKYHI